MKGMPEMPKGVESAESLEPWRILKREAPQQAKEIMARIPGFSEAEKEKQVAMLDAVIEGLTHDNGNRYIARELSLEHRVIELKHAYEVGMQAIGRN